MKGSKQMKYTILFDSTLRTRKGEHIPYYDEQFTDTEHYDQQIIKVHTGHGTMRNYRLHQVDHKHFIAELVHIIDNNIMSNNEFVAYLKANH